MADLHTAFSKTDAGLKEVQARTHSLSRPQRNLLILVDGRSPLASFARMVGGAMEELGGIADSLEQLGLIAPAGAQAHAASAGSAPSAADRAPETAGPEGVRAALVELAGRTFGAKAAKVVEKLNAAGATTADLLAAAEAAAKLAKLTIDEGKATAFITEARRIIAG